ncbi:MAG: hypothetical protein C4321_04695 [Chloroflexota bacterium]
MRVRRGFTTVRTRRTGWWCRGEFCRASRPGTAGILACSRRKLAGDGAGAARAAPAFRCKGGWKWGDFGYRPGWAAGGASRGGVEMELDELRARLEPFVRAKLEDPGARVVDLRKGTGHAGFSYFFDVESGAGERQAYFLRLPPPGVKLETADLMRQVTAVRALEGTGVPHAPITWAGTEPEWFGSPYFVQPRLPGDTLKDDYPERFSDAQLRGMARQAMRALAGIHQVPRERLGYLGEFWGYEFDVTRWDRFYERAAEQELLRAINEFRAANGVPPLKPSPNLSRAASRCDDWALPR